MALDPKRSLAEHCIQLALRLLATPGGEAGSGQAKEELAVAWRETHCPLVQLFGRDAGLERNPCVAVSDAGIVRVEERSLGEGGERVLVLV
jgi:hypothetical protein